MEDCIDNAIFIHLSNLIEVNRVALVNCYHVFAMKDEIRIERKKKERWLDRCHADREVSG
ncbi:MAG TPA: hypothetical protein VKK79_11375 [Candidatus Lokiarchaeia archaeon]|nr:hypothetical protein [Candidatus Lokiarchaeia archaeon]